MRMAVRLAGRCIGRVGVGGGAEPSIFYFLAPDVAGQGIASEIVAPFCAATEARFALNTLMAEVFCDNPASHRVLTKAGFVVIRMVTDLESAGRSVAAPGWIMRRG
ncbi:MAG: GNAT family N-acetyltransferase [Paracoccus sp. (in: a-proteobacteria)]|nr:GNAT family N-acetyltransferase [Paracoccus sp. (in: a-proteobacteria)]